MLEGIQLLRGLAAILVVLFHVASKQRGDYGLSLPILGSFASFGYSGVDLFFVLSGFVIAWITWPSHTVPSQVPRFLLKRVVRIFPTFWIVWIISAIVFVGYLNVEFYRVRPGSIFLNMCSSMLLLNPSIHTIIPQAWTLSWELLFYAIFSVFLVSPRRWFLPGLLLIPLDDFCLHFIAGGLVGFAVREYPARRPFPFIAAGIISWAIVMLGMAIGYLHAPTPLSRFGYFGTASAVLVYGLSSLDLRSPPSYPRPLLFLGDASYCIYLIHITVIFAMQSRIPHIFSHLGHIAWAFGAILLSLGAGCALHAWVERPMLSGLRRMSGAKQCAMLAVAAMAMIGVAWFFQSRHA
jgi:peptidoglycan/LPS O-acetylase OafA/YrhL